MVNEFAAGLFKKNGKCLDLEVPQMVYGKFDGVTWFMQKELLLAINREGKAEAITSGKFIKKHSLQSPSTVQTAAKALVDRQIVTFNQGAYEVSGQSLDA